MSVLSLLTVPNDYWESISKAPPIPEPTPFLAIVVRGGHRETTTSNARLLVVICGFIVGFISFIAIFLLRAVLVDFINDREPDATDCRRAMTSSKLLVPSFFACNYTNLVAYHLADVSTPHIGWLGGGQHGGHESWDGGSEQHVC